MPIDYKPFIHPEDRDALNKLQAIPGLDSLMKKFMQAVTEDMMHGINMASKINSAPRSFRNFTPSCGKHAKRFRFQNRNSTLKWIRCQTPTRVATPSRS